MMTKLTAPTSLPKENATNALSAKELFEISQDIVRNYSPMVSAKSSNSVKWITLTSKELREIGDAINRNYTPQLNINTPSLIVLPIDPEHLYVSWSANPSLLTPTLEDVTQTTILRIYPKPDETAKTTTKAYFNVGLDPEKNRQIVLVPKEHHASTYTAAIGKRDQDDCFIALAISKAVHTPRATLSFDDSRMFSTQLSQTLSSNQERLHNNNKNASGQTVN